MQKRYKSQPSTGPKTFTDEISVRGLWTKVPAIEINNQRIVTTGRLLKTARPKYEWCEDIQDPASLLVQIKKARPRADIFVFWQKLPEKKPKFTFDLDWYSLAALPLSTYDYWWTKQINAKTRNMVRKSAKKEIEIRLVDFDDTFVKGITGVFNETPVRQGYKFAHYGKTFETVKCELSKDIEKKIFLGAYYGDELVGFSILFNAGTFAVTNHFLCKFSHRNKATANGLMAKIVETCIDKGMQYLVYGNWHERSLGAFARHNGFEKSDLPKYYVPLTLKGKIALKLGVHQSMTAVMPKRLKSFLVELRRKWFSMPWYLK